MNDQPKQALRDIFQDRGISLLLDPTLLERLLREQCPQSRPEVTVLLNALREGIPAILRTELGHSSEAALVQRLQLQLQTNQSMQQEPARWAVEAWLGALRPFSAPLPAPTLPHGSKRYSREEFFGPGFSGARAHAVATDGLGSLVFGIFCLLLFWWFVSSPVEGNDNINANRYQVQTFAALCLGIIAIVRGAYKSITGFLASQQNAQDVRWYILQEAGVQIFVDDKEPIAGNGGFLIPWSAMDQFVAGPGGLFIKYHLPAALPSSRIMRADCRASNGDLFSDRFHSWYNAKAAGFAERAR